jgi:hypothetical protein
MSERLSTGLPLACSGDIYAAVPRIDPAIVPLTMVGEFEIVVFVGALSIALAKPKSRTLTFPSLVTLMLPGLRSR